MWALHAIYHTKNKNTKVHTLTIDENLIKATRNVKSNATCNESAALRRKHSSST